MKMKNSILFVTIIFGAFLVNAQEKGTSQINVGYGMASTLGNYRCPHRNSELSSLFGYY
jgi:hypothetical protein